MLAAVFAAEGRLSMEERPLPSISDAGEILVAVEACGVCGTDLQILATPPGHPATPGTIMGHEFVGRVVDRGDGVAAVEIGERVIVDPDPTCGSCDPCRAGRPANCLNVRALGVFRDGALASHVLAPARAAFPIDDNVKPEVAALAEPLACVVNATRTAAVRPGESVVIFGAGAIGCLFLVVLRASGASPIIVVEPGPERAVVATALGSDFVIAPDELDDRLAELLPHGAAVVVDAVGRLMDRSIEVAAVGGRVVLFGMDSTARPPIHQVEITEKSLSVLGSYITSFTFPEAIALLESGRLTLEPMISAVLPLAELENGFGALRDGSATKVVITP